MEFPSEVWQYILLQAFSCPKCQEYCGAIGRMPCWLESISLSRYGASRFLLHYRENSLSGKQAMAFIAPERKYWYANGMIINLGL